MNALVSTTIGLAFGKPVPAAQPISYGVIESSSLEFDAGGGEMRAHPRADAIDFWMDYEGPLP